MYGAALPTLSTELLRLRQRRHGGEPDAPANSEHDGDRIQPRSSGGYPITASGRRSSDYTINYVAGTLTITAAPLTITANDAAKVYGAVSRRSRPATAALSMGIRRRACPHSPTLATTAAASSHVLPGGYAIIALGASDPDYTISYQTGTLLVTPAPLIITANNASKMYGAPRRRCQPVTPVLSTGMVPRVSPLAPR